VLLSTDFPLLIKTLYMVYVSLRERREGERRKTKKKRRKKGEGKNLHLEEN